MYSFCVCLNERHLLIVLIQVALIAQPVSGRHCDVKIVTSGHSYNDYQKKAYNTSHCDNWVPVTSWHHCGVTVTDFWFMHLVTKWNTWASHNNVWIRFTLHVLWRKCGQNCIWVMVLSQFRHITELLGNIL